MSYSDLLVYFCLILNAMISSNALALVYPLSLFLYALIEYPKPNKKYFRFLWGYTTFLLCLKFLYQFKVFCECYSGALHNHVYGLYPNCPLGPGNATCLQVPVTGTTYPGIVGLYQFTVGDGSNATEAYIKGVEYKLFCSQVNRSRVRYDSPRSLALE